MRRVVWSEHERHLLLAKELRDIIAAAIDHALAADRAARLAVDVALLERIAEEFITVPPGSNGILAVGGFHLANLAPNHTAVSTRTALVALMRRAMEGGQEK
jgi:hypothetical protein